MQIILWMVLVQYTAKYAGYCDDYSGAIAAERYSEGRASQLRILEKILICIIACILLLMLGHAVYAFVIQRKNIDLNIKAYIDSATGLPNRERCNQILQGQGVLSEETGYACIMFDLNNLKIVNDTLGHKEGDILIVQFANILRSVASEKVFIGRYGGDEFIAIIFETNEDVVKSLLIEIEQKVKAYNDSIDGSAISYAVGYEISFFIRVVHYKPFWKRLTKKCISTKLE